MILKEQNKINIVDYDYSLPDEKIATHPLPERDESKLLVYRGGKINHSVFKHLPSYMQSDILLISNDTKVIQARLIFYKPTGARIEIFCLEPVKPSGYYRVLQQKDQCTWKCLVGNLKKWKGGKLVKDLEIDGQKIGLTAIKQGMEGNTFEVTFKWTGQYTFSEILENLGSTPIPPYLDRQAEESDRERYQTVYSSIEGSVAAPTAGLHFTRRILKEIEGKGIINKNITLHVGAGTFLPVSGENAREHTMHTEHFFVSLDTLQALLANADNICAVGTTSARALESLYWMGVKLAGKHENPFCLEQWENEKLRQDMPPSESLGFLVNYLQKHNLRNIGGITGIMIAPGYTFRYVKAMITNFHQPKSTLLLLIAAFIGEDWKKVYRYALENDFRFLSYGDSSLLVR